MKRIFLLLISVVLLKLSSFSQSTLVVGSGSFTTTSNAYGIMRSITTANSWNRNAYIYPASLVNTIPANSTITSLEYYASNASAAALPAGTNFKIYLKNTTSADFGATSLDWTTEIASATLVYNSDPATIVGTTSGFKQFPLSPTFVYGGNNLEVLVEYTQTTAPTATILWTYDSDAGVPAYTVNQGKYINGTGTPTTTLSNSNQRHPNMKINYTPFVYANDVTVTALVSPASRNLTVGTAIPITATIKNNGSASQTAVPVYYKVDNNAAVGPVNTTGTMAQNDVQNVTLPNYTPTNGYHTLKVYTALATDQNIPNDTLTYTFFAGPVSSFPFLETFTYGYGWSANANIWNFTTVTTEANGSGGRAAQANFYNIMATAPADTLRSPVLNFASLSKPILAYNFSHQTVTAATPEPDSLKIVISIDGGVTWSAPIFTKSANGSPSLNTVAASGTAYNPQARGDWRHELIDLSAYAGQANVKIGFIAISGYGNQLVIDNILISNATAFSSSPVTATGPQSASSGVTVNFTSIIPNGRLKIARFAGAPPTSSSTVFTTNTTATTQDGSIFTPTTISDVWYTVTYDSLAGYSISIDVSTLANSPNKSKLYIVKRSSQNDAWVALSTTLSGSTLTASGLTSFSDFAIAGDVNNPLPIALLGFNGTLMGQDVSLNWNTVNEVNNKGFGVERSIDGVRFANMAFVNGSGTSSTGRSYQFTDVNVPSGIIYYRLKQIDLDGKFTYSSVVKIAKRSNKGFELVVVNPSKNFVNALISTTTSERVSLQLVNTSGQLIATKNVELSAGSNSVSIGENAKLSTGIYVLKIVRQNETITKQVIVE